MRSLILALALVATQAAAADQFDLICTGKHWRIPAGLDRPIVVRYRLDLPANKWCKGDCTSTEPFAKVRDDMIDFVDLPEKFPGDDRQSDWVNRLNGMWMESEFRAGGAVYSRSEGRCEIADFSGFPVPHRKF